MVKLKVDNGYYLFKLDDLLKKNNLSINQFMKDTDTDFKVVKRIMAGTLSRFDIYVVARFCDYFHCGIEDIIEYVSTKK